VTLLFMQRENSQVSWICGSGGGTGGGSDDRGTDTGSARSGGVRGDDVRGDDGGITKETTKTTTSGRKVTLIMMMKE